MEPALDPVWMGPIMIAFVAVWFAAAMVVFKDRPAKGRRVETATPALPDTHRSGEKRHDHAA